MGRSGAILWATESSVSTAKPKEFTSSGMAWLISGSLWYGRPAITMPWASFSSIQASVSSPFARMSSLNFMSSSQA